MVNPQELVRRINYYSVRCAQEFSFLTGLDFSMPTFVMLIMTHRCNARCKHCYIWKNKASEELTSKDWFRILDELQGWLGPVFISITGGEPLLKENMILILRHAVELGLEVEFLSNGYIMDDATVLDVVKTGVQGVQISFDGSTPDMHNFIRGRDDFFERTTSALQSLTKYRNEFNQNLKIVAKATIMSHNLDELAGIAKWAKDNNITGVKYQAIEQIYGQERDPDWYKNCDLWINDANKVMEVIDELVSMKYNGYPILNTVENLEFVKGYFAEPELYTREIHSHTYGNQKNRCKTWANTLMIYPNGDLRMCYQMSPFGNVKNGYIGTLWGKRTRCWKRPCKYFEQV